MKKITRLVMAGAVAVACSSAFADSFDIKVSGVIKPAACTPTLAGGGTFDYGNIGTAALNPTALTLLDVKSDTLTITCDAVARVALKGADNRAGTGAFTSTVAFFGLNVDANLQYGLGTASGKNIGSYAFRFKPGTFTADGTKVDSIYSTNAGSSWTSSSGFLASNGSQIQSWAKTGLTVPVAAKVFTGTLELQAAIDKTSNLDMSKEIDLDGLATVSLVYL
ncbi:DUF1120 domain-containing protein [Paraburkholderia lacunae]|nr:DUF1120 domain-containing protein [Paraburkholderia lacunae]